MLNSDIKSAWKRINNSVLAIPTNLGYKTNGANVMGAGLALYIRDLHSEIPFRYGHWIKQNENTIEKDSVKEFADKRLIMLPTKDLNKYMPHLSWKADARLDIIDRTMKHFLELHWDRDKIYLLPLLGCGNGKLTSDDVLPILEKHIGDRTNILIFKD